MSDKKHVGAGSESASVEAPAQTSEVETTEVLAVAETPENAGVAAETLEAPKDASRTGFAEKGLRAGDTCTCPDGRTGTVHRFDAGLICIPNHEQGN